MKKTLVVSACLAGKACRYDGASKPNASVQAAITRWKGAVVLVCPEEEGELGTPRPAAELVGGDGALVWEGQAAVRVVEDGRDVTEAFKRGALKALEKAEGATEALLKARSPSCGCGQTSIEGRVQAGDGVFAALLKQKGIALQTEETLPLLEDDSIFKTGGAR